jgi:hypothetical protein
MIPKKIIQACIQAYATMSRQPQKHAVVNFHQTLALNDLVIFISIFSLLQASSIYLSSSLFQRYRLESAQTWWEPNCCLLLDLGRMKEGAPN